MRTLRVITLSPSRVARPGAQTVLVALALLGAIRTVIAAIPVSAVGAVAPSATIDVTASVSFDFALAFAFAFAFPLPAAVIAAPTVAFRSAIAIIPAASVPIP